MLYNNPIGVIVINMNMTMLWSIYRNDHHGLLQSITILLVSQSPQGLKETLHGNTPRMYVCHICLPPQGKMLMRIRNQTWPGNWKSHEIPYQKMEVFHGKIIVSLGDFPWKVRSRIQCLRSARAVLAESRRARLTGGVVWCLEQLTCQVFSGGCSRKLVNQPYWKRKWTIKKAFDQWISMNNGCDFVQTWELLHLFWPFQRGLTWLVTDKPQLSAKLNWFQGRDRRVHGSDNVWIPSSEVLTATGSFLSTPCTRIFLHIFQLLFKHSPAFFLGGTV